MHTTILEILNWHLHMSPKGNANLFFLDSRCPRDPCGCYHIDICQEYQLVFVTDSNSLQKIAISPVYILLSTLKMKFKETELKYISLVELISNCPDYHIDNIEKIPNIKELKYFFFVMIFVSGYFLSCLLHDFSSPTKKHF